MNDHITPGTVLSCRRSYGFVRGHSWLERGDVLVVVSALRHANLIETVIVFDCLHEDGLPVVVLYGDGEFFDGVFEVVR